MRVPACLLGCALLWSRGALAEPSVRWDAPPGCLTQAQARAEIARLLNEPLADVAVELTADVRIRRDAKSGFEATIEFAQDRTVRKRVLSDGDCTVLSHAAAVVVALAIDPATELTKPETTATSGETPAPSDDSRLTNAREVRENEPADRASAPSSPAGAARATAPTEEAETSPEMSAPTVTSPPAGAGGSGLRSFVGAAGALATGILPDVAPSVALSAGIATRLFRTAVRLSYAPPKDAVLNDPAGVGGRIGLIAFDVEAGLHPRVSRIELPFLAGVEAGAFDATAQRLSDGQSAHPLWLACYVGAGALFVWGPAVTTGLRLEALVPLRRPRFAVQDDLGVEHVVHRPGVLAGRASVEIELHFR